MKLASVELQVAGTKKEIGRHPLRNKQKGRAAQSLETEGDLDIPAPLLIIRMLYCSTEHVTQLY